MADDEQQLAIQVRRYPLFEQYPLSHHLMGEERTAEQRPDLFRIRWKPCLAGRQGRQEAQQVAFTHPRLSSGIEQGWIVLWTADEEEIDIRRVVRFDQGDAGRSSAFSQWLPWDPAAAKNGQTPLVSRRMAAGLPDQDLRIAGSAQLPQVQVILDAPGGPGSSLILKELPQSPLPLG